MIGYKDNAPGMHQKTGVFPPSAMPVHPFGVHSIYVNLISVSTCAMTNRTDELKDDENAT